MRKDWHLKHRPSQLDDLVGQKSVVDTLKQSCKLDRYANSYFLSGVKGCGKTSTARILATLMNCENVVDGRLCGKCRACQTIPRDMSSDVIELDGAAHGKVDDISGLIEGAKWSPVELKRKIYLIDECLGYHSRVETENGLMYIGEIVKNRIDVNVKSYNELSKQIEWKPISEYHTNSGKDIYSIHFETLGVLHASDNHKVMTPDGWKRVGDLNVGDNVCRSGLILNSYQEQVALGSLMGDASIGRNKPTIKKYSRTNARIRFVHGHKQVDYLKWKSEIFANFSCQKTPMLNKLCGFAKLPTSYFNTSVNSQFNKMQDLFYKDGVKTVTDEVLNKLGPIAMAIWFCDDGSLNRIKTLKGFSNYITLHTQGFSLYENELIKAWLKDRWNIDSVVLPVKKGLFRISIPKDSSFIFLNLIAHYVPDVMRYKLKGFSTGSAGETGFWDITRNKNNYGLIVEKITKKNFLKRAKTTYDLEIAENHNYFVSGTLVHNCHRLTGSAVSALLKITENPPDYLTFIFCTTDPDKVIDTIKSRSQRFNFRRLTSNEIMLRLKAIAGQENVEIDEESLFIIAKKSGGSMRDAIVALEQISVALGDNEGSKITFEKTEKYFGLPSKHIIFNIIGSMVDGNFPLLMDQVNDLLMSNVGSQEVAFEISEILRNIMLVKINKGKCPWMELPDSEITELLKFSGKIGLGQLDKISRQFSSIKKELEYSINERWVLESVLIHCAAILKGK